MSQEGLTKINPIPLDEPIDMHAVTTNESSIVIPPPRNNKPWLIPLLLKIQKYSAYTFVSFLGIHLTSVIIVPILPIDPDIKQDVFSMAKAVFQSLPLYENFIIYGSSLLHVCSGIGLRLFRKNKRRRSSNDNDKLRISDDDQDIGLGGISNIFGLGYKKSWISTTFGITPLQFSGYMIIPLVAYHFYKFRYVPWAYEGDSSLVNLDYISYVLNLKYPWLNTLGLMGLIWTISYHVVNGVMKLQHKFNKQWKKIGLGLINLIGSLGMISVYYFKFNHCEVEETGFLGKVFVKYIQSSWL
ncbi:uncharacterized protein J8A68_003112 [[Candida] subhashii]|uniref:Mitochondrial adapter protein MCP1 transmembrane domain-containing protein n=1 Tax=[Candida] subhashii TaxID=561895 RepID=A0A8J5UZ13_9ASCO|nr:uncharacterized protein J8A68_003112 [[Candida] subhashii]KAG7663364.1 hypothetical protein J8A68_003112 [[Candida] subhashii]